ncbi:MAG: putative peptidoglycan lipid flippase, partial [Acidimicrobiaceae bacterium]|nr:putative peptidoglycan lipid flippase [Acidimicrobiaceae bacterium]
LTADTLSLLALGLAGFSAYLLLIRAYQAMQDTRTAFWLYLVENGVNIVLALALFPWLGVQGLGLSLSIAYTVGTVVALRGVTRRGASLEGAAIVQSLVRILVATLVMAMVVLVVSRSIGSGSSLRLVARLGASVGAGATVYLVVARALGVDELMALLRLRRRSASPSRPPEGPTR